MTRSLGRKKDRIRDLKSNNKALCHAQERNESEIEDLANQADYIREDLREAKKRVWEDIDMESRIELN